jgi:DNA-binding winged helix-turn-helix (wHTH) protein/TolB-like protein
VLATDLGGSHPDVLVFEDFRLDVPRAEFTRADKSVPLRPKAFALLLYLACNAGRVVSKAELLAQVWVGVVVTDDSLSQCVGELRAALGERGPSLIKTLPKRGYLFDTAVTGGASAVQPAARTGDAGDPARFARPRAGLWAATAGAIVLALATLIIGVKTLDSTKPVRIDAALAARRSIVVVPFTDMSSPKAPHFAEGVTQEIVNNLGRLPDALVVVGAASGSPPAASTMDARTIGRDFDVRHVLTGSVRRDAERTAIEVQMARSDTGALMWSERFEVDRGDAPRVRIVVAPIEPGLC